MASGTEHGRADKAGRPVVLCILDGFGWRETAEANAVLLAKKPTFDRLWAELPHTLLRTDGLDVGLPVGQFGNSEVGHMNLGAGRVVMQELPKIDQTIEDGSLGRSEVLRGLMDAAKAGSGVVHLLGLISPGGVHAHQRHVSALARLLAEQGLQVRVHAFMDGRDTPPRAGREYLATFLQSVADRPAVQVASVSGRYFAMDRDKRWERVGRALAAMLDGRGPRYDDALQAINAAYADDKGDEFIEPAVIGNYSGMQDGDAVLCANFRSDRVREIMSALVVPEVAGLERSRMVRFSAAVGMTSYSAELDRLLGVLFPPQPLNDLLGEVVAAAGLRQLRMAETEKYPHVTFFFNGGEERPYPGEERIMVPSPKVATYDLQPEMSAVELTDRFVQAVGDGSFDFVLINFANPDMVGHTGVLKAAIKAVETVDACLGRLVEAVRKLGGTALVTADHGNCETMVDPETGQPHTSHTLNPVPLMIVGGPADMPVHSGRLADVAPTVLALLGVRQPAAMTGKSLLGLG